MVDVVAALVWKDGKIMICQRPTWKARALLWEFVGGKVENGESLEDALIRECKEEIGVEVKVGDLYADVYHTYPDIDIHLFFFNCTLNGEEPKKLEHNDVRWVEPSTLTDYDFCPADKDLIKRIMKESAYIAQK